MTHHVQGNPSRTQQCSKFENWGGHIFIYSCSQTIKQSISKEINCAEDDMNMYSL